MNSNLSRLPTAIALALLTSVTSVAIAQTADSDPPSPPPATTTLKKVQVTGTLIRSVDTETSQPVFVITHDDIQKKGMTSVMDVLNNLSVAGAGTTRGINNGNDGSAYLNLRNLGYKRTLVLVNGRRWMSDLTGGTDLNTIPASIIERVEVLKDGASAIYGSDAIAGVINIITRSGFQGGEISTYFGEYGQRDGHKSSVTATFGATTDRNSITIGLSDNVEAKVDAANRSMSKEPLYRGGSSAYSATSASGTIPAAGTDPRRVLPDTAKPSGLASDPYYDIKQYELYPKDKTGAYMDAYGYNFAKNQYLLTPQKRDSVYLQNIYDLTSNLHITLEGVYNRRRSAQRLAGAPLVSAQIHAPLSGQSYYNPYNKNYDGDGRPVDWVHRLAEFPRVTKQDVESSHLYSGINGSFEVSNHHFDWDVGYGYSTSQVTETGTGTVNTVRLKSAVGPSAVVGGAVRCVDSNNQVIADCVPFNPLSPQGTVNKKSLDYLLFTSHSLATYQNEDYTANITGDIVALPAGPLSFASGFEHRAVSGKMSPDAMIAAGYTSGNAAKPTQGQYALNEYYLELSAPLLKDLPAAQHLDLDLATRYSDYKTFGGTTNYKLGVKWAPVKDLLTRANYATGFRAPTISDLYAGTEDDFPIYSDPCSNTSALYAQSAAGCRAHQVPQNFTANYAGGRKNAGQPNAPFTNTSNPLLDPEKSKTRTIGIVYSPSAVEGLNVSIDWWKISIANAIQTPKPNYILQQCYTQQLDAWCRLVTRDTLGNIQNITIQPLNYGQYLVEGYDIGAQYTTAETALGTFSAQSNSSLVVRDKVYQDASTGWEDLKGKYKADEPHWRLRSDLTVNWSLQKFSLAWTAVYFSRMIDVDTEPSSEGYYHVASATYHNVVGSYNLSKNSVLSIGLQNVFNRNPPFARSASANSFDANYPIQGRFAYLTYSQKF